MEAPLNFQFQTPPKFSCDVTYVVENSQQNRTANVIKAHTENTEVMVKKGLFVVFAIFHLAAGII